MRVLDNTVLTELGVLARRGTLIAKLMTERNARLKKYGSVLRLSDGRMIAGPSVDRASRCTPAYRRVVLRYEAVRLPTGCVPVVMWIMTPEGQSIAAWKVPALDGEVLEPVITISE